MMLMAPVGDDANGMFLKRHCQQLGIETQCMVTIKGATTSSYVSIVDEAEEMQVAIADMSLIDDFGEAELDKFLPQLQAARLVVLDANLAPVCLAFLMKKLPQQNFLWILCQLLKPHE